MRVSFLACVLALVASPLAADAVYDVGSNTSFATVNAALSQAAADLPGPLGVTVRVRVLDAATVPFSLDYGVLPLQPQPAFRLVIESGPGVRAVVAGSGNEGVRVSGVAHVTLSGLDVQGFNLSGVRLDNTDDTLISGCRLLGAGTAGVEAHNCTGLRVVDCDLAPAAGSGALVQGGSGAALSGSRVPAGAGISYGFVLQGSDGGRLDNNLADGADYAFNVFSSAGVTVNACTAIVRGGARGLVLDNSSGALVTRNLLVGQEVGMELQSAAGCVLAQNTVWEHGTAALYAHNASQPLTIRNSLWQGFMAYFLDASTQAGLSSDRNGFNYDAQLGVGQGSYPDLAAWKAAAQDAGSTEADPLFATLNGTVPAHFKLQAGSPVQGFGADASPWLSPLTDYFGNYLSAGGSWDPGFHVVSVTQNTPTVTPTPTPVLPTPTPTSTITPTVSPTFTPSPIGTATRTPTTSPTPTITPTYTLTPYAFQKGRVLSYPNPWSPEGGALNIVYEPTERATVRIFDMAGELVIELDGGVTQPNLGHAAWDGRDRNGNPVPSGLYLFSVATPQGTKFTRFTVLH